MALPGTARDPAYQGVRCMPLQPNTVAMDPHLKPSLKDSSPELH